MSDHAEKDTVPRYVVDALVAERDGLRARVERLEAALRDEIQRVCECDGEDIGGGPGVGVIDVERSTFDYGADAYTGAGDVITDYFDCPCAPLRAALSGLGDAGESTFAWLIERGQPEGETRPLWWIGSQRVAGESEWTTDANEACRFPTKEEAERVFGADRPGQPGRAVEHGWFPSGLGDAR